MVSPYLMIQPRPYWKALADTGRADYFRWDFRAPNGREYVLSVGKAHSDRDGLHHAASADTCEVVLWCKDNARRDLSPVEVSPLLHPWSRFFSDQESPIANHMPDSILTALVGAIGYYLGEMSFGHSMLNAFYHRASSK